MVCTVLGAASVAWAGNNDSIPMGDLAAVAAAAVVAAGDDCGSVAYNPAGLVGIDRNVVSLSASLFRVQATQVPGYLVTQTPDGTAQAAASRGSFDSVPPAMIFARRLRPDLAGALSLTVPESITADANNRSSDSSARSRTNRRSPSPAPSRGRHLRSRRRAASRAPSLRDRDQSLILGSTFALRYAYGWGRASGLRSDISSTDPEQFAVIASTPGSVHEVSFYIGSGVNF